jgi:hypothetical protein
MAVAKTITSLIEFDAFTIHAGIHERLSSASDSSPLLELILIGVGMLRGVLGYLGATDVDKTPTDEAASLLLRMIFLTGPTVAVAIVLSSA